MNLKYFLLSLLLTTLTITSPYYTQQEERTLQPELTRDQSLFPLQSTGIWTEVHPLIPRVDYWGVHFVNADTGWAVGEGGAIIKTTNGGEKWIWYEGGVGNTLRTVSAINNGQRVIAAGDGGIIIISEDAGETWNQLSSPTTRNIWNMQMITDLIGWIVGETGTALKTTDGGYTWIQQPMPYPNSSYWDISFVNINVGYISCPSGIVIKTTNGGGNWITQVAGDTRSLWTIYAIDSLKVCAGGFAGKLVYTSNGGNTWIPLQDFGTSYNKITFADSLNGIGAGDGSIRTSDGGLTWYLLNIHNITDNNVALTPLGVGYMVGNSMSLLKTTNKGANWSRTILNDNLTGVNFVDEQNGFFVGKLIYKTSDNAETLTPVVNFPYDTMYNPYCVTFTDSVTGYVGGQPTHIIKTTDAGESWGICNITGLPNRLGSVQKILFLTQEIGWAVTTRGNILKTTDGGINWFTQLNAGASVGFTGIHFVDSLYGWTSNVNKRPYKTTDGGNTWSEQTSLNFYITDDIYFMNQDTGWITNDYTGYILYKTTNSGVNWEIVNGLYQPRKFSFFPNTSRWWIYGFSNLYETTNEGESWDNITPQIPLFSKFIAPFNWLGYGVGGTGYIISYFDSTYVPVELISFNAELIKDGVKLTWVTATELNNRGYEIQKSYDMQNWTMIGFVEGEGNSTEYLEYSFIDVEFAGDEMFYRLKQVDFDGSFEYSKIIEVNLNNIPLTFDLQQNYPNPFNNTTIITYRIPSEDFITLKVYDVLGNAVATLIEENKKAGYYSLNFSADDLSSGIYFYKLIAGKYSSTKKLILLK